MRKLTQGKVWIQAEVINSKAWLIPAAKQSPLSLLRGDFLDLLGDTAIIHEKKQQTESSVPVHF